MTKAKKDMNSIDFTKATEIVQNIFWAVVYVGGCEKEIANIINTVR